MEIGGKLGLVIDAFPNFLAEHSFNIADKMLEEYKRRRPGYPPRGFMDD